MFNVIFNGLNTTIDDDFVPLTYKDTVVGVDSE